MASLATVGPVLLCFFSLCMWFSAGKGHSRPSVFVFLLRLQHCIFYLMDGRRLTLGPNRFLCGGGRRLCLLGSARTVRRVCSCVWWPSSEEVSIQGINGGSLELWRECRRNWIPSLLTFVVGSGVRWSWGISRWCFRGSNVSIGSVATLTWRWKW